MLKKTLICILLVGSVHFAMAESLNDALNRSRSGNSNNNRPQVEDLFTGDVKLACEATLCLSTGNRPSECQPAIHRYFSIRHKRMGDTIRARHNFLRLCP
ncbi:TPA: TrbM/KikA/MpfK family conjugal transfer protein, partial [Neisseria gonorrhoeae]